MKAFLNKISYGLFGLKQDDELKPKEAFSYSIAGFGQNLIVGFVGGAYLTYFFINGLLISAYTVGLMMLFCRLFDAFTDPIMGSIVDRTRSKWGKCRPYLLVAPIPIALFTVLLFLPLDIKTIGEVGTVATATGIYVIWSVFYTIVDVPYWGLASSMTSDTHKRGNMLMVARIFCTVGGGIIALVVPQLTSWLTRDFTDSSGEIIVGLEASAAEAVRSGYIWIALVICVLAIPTFWIGFKNTKERFYSAEKPKSLRHNLGLVLKNKPLLLVVAVGVLGSAKMLYMSSAIFFCDYALRTTSFMGMSGPALFTLITFTAVPGGLLASVLTPWCTRKFGKKATYIASHLFGGAVLFIMFFIGWDAPWKLFVALTGLIFVAIPMGFWNVLSYAMIADSIDYLELKTGERGEGICFAMQTFINKVSMAVNAAVTCFGLAWAGIVATNRETVTTQAINTLWLISVLIPAISMALSAVPLFFYKFTEQKQREAVEEVNARKASNA
ncbi:MAG: glycoside-pentoside-hexuronide (GPH):cation symporter [Firmicutes bacterium]|nr:glycoside-pentoside-hexuronide (GPH):cation symporter [Bacillota bacterium]